LLKTTILLDCKKAVSKSIFILTEKTKEKDRGKYEISLNLIYFKIINIQNKPSFKLIVNIEHLFG